MAQNGPGPFPISSVRLFADSSLNLANVAQTVQQAQPVSNQKSTSDKGRLMSEKRPNTGYGKGPGPFCAILTTTYRLSRFFNTSPQSHKAASPNPPTQDKGP